MIRVWYGTIAGLQNCISARRDLKDDECDARARQSEREGLARLVTMRNVALPHTARFRVMPKK